VLSETTYQDIVPAATVSASDESISPATTDSETSSNA
jgi:hypothetical protein